MRRALLAAVGVVIGALLVAVALSAGDEIGDELRRQYAKLSPYRLLVVVAAGGLVVALVSYLRANGVSWPAGRRLVSRLHALLIAVPAGIALPVIVGAVAGLRISVNDAQSLPGVFGDELIYTDLAKSFAEDGTLMLRGVVDNGHSILYPVWISPAYALANDGVEAFRAVQVVNALTMALAAVPAYYLARRVVTHGWSLTVALLSVLIPATAYSALVMTESLFYPIFVTATLALTLMLERPTLARQLLTVGLILVLVAVRTQALALVPAVATAVVVDGLRASSLGSRLKSFWPTWAALGAVAALALIASQVGSEAPTGAYGALLDTYNPLEVVRWAARSTAGYLLEVGVVALAALPLALGRLLRRDAPTAERALGATSLSVCVWVLVSVAVLSASPFGLNILHARSLFFVTPLVLVCFAYWLVSGLPRPLYPTLAIVAVSLGVVLLLPASAFMSTAFVDSPTNVLWVALKERITDVPVDWFVTAAAVVGTAVFLRARTATLPLACFLVTVLFVNANFAPRSTITREDSKALGWVDQTLHALHDDEHATVVHVAVDSDQCPNGSDSYQGEAVTWTEFFNKSVNRVYGVLGPVGNDGLTTPQLTLRPNGELWGPDGPISPAYAVLDSRVRVVGTEVDRLDLHDLPGFDTKRAGALTLWQPDKPLRLVFPGPLLSGNPQQLACPEFST
jgi:hypothetical protein